MTYSVTLLVYDLSGGAARAMGRQLLNIDLDVLPHTGIEVYGIEYFFSGGVQKLGESIPACLAGALADSCCHWAWSVCKSISQRNCGPIHHKLS
eukprot:5851961-Pleurochrysis_carterae.AAC.1